ncbi:MAG: hypothetical protein ABR985_12190 [Methanotrichaceae archaeon]
MNLQAICWREGLLLGQIQRHTWPALTTVLQNIDVPTLIRKSWNPAFETIPGGVNGVSPNTGWLRSHFSLDVK